MEKYTLIVAEKPEAARRIAHALDFKGEPKKGKEGSVPYFIALRDRRLIVVPALGHLYNIVHERGSRNFYPVFSFKWVPRSLGERGGKKILNWIDAISKLAEDADEYIDASDYDIEGSLIGYCVLKYACKDKDKNAKRMKFSTLTKNELEKSYEERLPHLDFGLIKAGKIRHEIDWLYGVNLSRALTLGAKRWSKRYTTLSTGRVQGPTLNFLVEKEKEIRSYVPTPYWSIKAEAEVMGSTYLIEYERKVIRNKKETEEISRECEGCAGEIKKVDVRKFLRKPPFPFDLGSLQSTAYGLFGYTPKQTLNIAQRLYLEALISYPRTSSQKLPSTINYAAILTLLSKDRSYKDLTLELLKTELKPNEGQKKDPAHPAIYPTGNLPERKLSRAEKTIFDLVVRRFMAVFGEKAVKESVKVSIEVNRHLFNLKGGRVLKDGWTRFYKPYYKVDEVYLPPVKEGERVHLKHVMVESRFSNPPPRYNPSSLLNKMDQAGIGTKATRADIIEALYDRGYISEREMTVTDLGFSIIEVLGEHCPSVVSVELTLELEEKMDQVQNNKNKGAMVLFEAVEKLMPVLEKFKENEDEVGESLSNAIKKTRMQDRVVGKCPNCGTGNLMILYSRKTKKRFIGCTNYFKNLCETSFPLPQRGSVKPLRKKCRACGWPIVQIFMKGRKPWFLCINSYCPLKEERS